MIHSEEAAADVWVLTLDRPDRRNALDPEHWQALESAVREAAAGGARCIVITGAGRTFCAGADLGQVTSAAMVVGIESAFAAVREVAIPVIAYVNGAAVGAGAQLAVSCDLRVVGARARFRVPAAALGLPVHPRTVRRMGALAGDGTARAMLLGCEWIEGERAHALGLAERQGSLEDAVAWASEIAGFAPLALRYLKEQLQPPDVPEPAAFTDVVSGFLASEDFAEAARAREEDRRPRFTGR